MGPPLHIANVVRCPARLGAPSLARLLVALRRSPKAQKPSASNDHELGSGTTVTFTLLSTRLAINVFGMLSIKRAIGIPSGSLNQRSIVLSTTLKIFVVGMLLTTVTIVPVSVVIVSTRLKLLSTRFKRFVTGSLSITMDCDVGVSKTALCEDEEASCGPVVTLIPLSTRS